MRILIALPLLVAFVACQSPRPAPSEQVVVPPRPAPTNPSPAPQTTPPAPRLIQSKPTPPQTSRFDLGKLSKVDEAITTAISAGKTPGGVLWVERKGQVYQKAFGNRAVVPTLEPSSLDTIYDMASLTKVIATAPAIVKLHELGKLNIHSPVADYLPDFAVHGKDKITLRHLLTHSSGLRPGLSLSPAWVGNEHAIKLACNEKLRTEPGTEFKYSDINFILLGEIVHRVSGLPLHEFTQRELYQPLGMADTGFLPRSSKQIRIAPTTKTETGVTRGVVHDPTSARMGGVAGHAGLFSTAKDLSRFARMLLNDGQLNGRRILKPSSIAMMTANHSPAAIRYQRGLGWDISSPYSSPRGNVFQIGSFGHTGWTGTSIWIDPFSETFVIFLANRNHPTEDGSVVALRRTISTLVAEAVKGYDFPSKQSNSTTKPVRKQTRLKTLNGIDTLKKAQFAPIANQRIGLITNHTGRSLENESTIDLLHQAGNVNLVSLFSPEHGIRGKEDSKVSDSKDTKTGLPIYSLYGATRKPLPEHLNGLDALVFDIQDIGCRFYTYISTMGLAMEAAAESGIRFVVLDRLNPITGSRVEGPVLNGETSFVGFHQIPLRHGMTVGELAHLFKKENKLDLDLKVIPLENWKREAWLDGTQIPWINPSPNMRSLTQAALYPGIGVIEMTQLSVGRGTDTPFELIGAPYIDKQSLSKYIQALKLPGLSVEPISFVPKASKFANQTCQGLRFKITNRDQFKPIDLGIQLTIYLHLNHPQEFDLSKVNRLLIDADTIQQIKDATPFQDIRKSWAPAMSNFMARRAPHLLYP